MRDSHRMHDGIDLHLDNRQIAAFVIASLVVLGAVFSVGVLVGKQLVTVAAGPARPGDALAAIDEKEKVRTRDSVTGTGGDSAASPETPRNYQEELTKPSTASPAIEPTKATAKAEPKKDEPKKDEPKEAARKEEAAKKDEPKKEEAKKKESLTAAFDKAANSDDAGEPGSFTLQVASLPSQQEAEKLVGRLTGKGLKPYIVEADVPGKGHVFRVRSGSYATKEEAENGLKAFKKKSALPAIIVSK